MPYMKKIFLKIFLKQETVMQNNNKKISTKSDKNCLFLQTARNNTWLVSYLNIPLSIPQEVLI